MMGFIRGPMSKATMNQRENDYRMPVVGDTWMRLVMTMDCLAFALSIVTSTHECVFYVYDLSACLYVCVHMCQVQRLIMIVFSQWISTLFFLKQLFY